VVDAVLLKPLPYPEPERIVTLWNRYGTTRTASSPPDYMDRRRESHLLESSASWTSRSANLTIEGEARRVETTRVTSDFFRVMGVDSLTGPTAFPEETSGSGERIAILSFGLWQSAYGGKDMLGRSIRVDGESYLVIGVMPRGFDYPTKTEIFLPLVFTPEQLGDGFRGNEYLFEVARMKQGVGLSELSGEMGAIAASVLERVPARREFLQRNGFGAEAIALREHLVGESKTALSMLAAAVFVVLLVTGANVAHILPASGSSRFHELVLRSSLGATRRRLFSQLVAESVLLAMAGGVLGLALSFVVVGATEHYLATELPGASEIALDGRAVAFTFLVALGMGVLCGLAPARMASGAALRASTRSSSSGRARRLRSALVVSQLALALVLMIAAGLLVRSYERLSSRHPGYETASRLRFGIDFPRSLYPEPEGRAALARDFLERLRTIPGVCSVAASARTWLGGNPWTGTFRPEGFDLASGVPVPGAEFNVVSPDYLRSLGIPLLRGRDFSSTDDRSSTPVVLVDRWTEERFWPEGAVGRRIDVGHELYEVVGVVGHVQYESLDEPGRFQLYFPALQRDWWRHLGLRLALGATRRTILGLVLKEGSILFGLGVALGWMGALAASGLFSELQYAIEPTDTTSYVAVTGALSVVALAAALVPALRASRTDPWSSLRAE
jgi:putative ABC transport system permease protein